MTEVWLEAVEVASAFVDEPGLANWGLIEPEAGDALPADELELRLFDDE